MSLKNKTITGISWSFIDNIANSGITFIVGLVLANILTPEEFGIIGMITIFIAISNSIIDSGFSNALIRKIDIKSIDYNTVFYFNLVMSLLLYLILYVATPSISRFFKEPILTPVTRVLGIILIINGLAIIQRTILVKTIDFKTQTKISFISSIVSGIIGIGMALWGYGVWSLVGQQVSRQFLNTLLLWGFNTWRPAYEYSNKSFRELFGFGSKLLLSGLIDTVYKNIYYIVIGRFYSAAQLGQYTRALQFKEIFASNLTSVIQKVSYPILSSIQEEPERLKAVYRKAIKSTMLITFACMLGLAATAKPLIIILIGEKWIEAVGYLQIICFSGMLYPLHAINLNILKVKGRSDLFLKLEIIKKMFSVIPIILGVFLGIKFMLWASVFNSFVAYFLNSHYSENLIDYSTSQQIKDILPTFIISAIVALCMWSVSFLSVSHLIMLPVQCIVGLIIAWFIYENIRVPEYLEVKEIASSFILKRK
jgi:O-antigen/teichoic acid export membrane protein